jgi:hypothetical protein
MPTVLREGGFDFQINTNDHKPAHVHAFYQGALVIIEFESDVNEREVFGSITAAQRRRALRIVRERRGFFLRRWTEIHG